MKERDRKAQERAVRSQSELMLDRAKVLLNGASHGLERAQKLLQRKSTGPHNFQKRMARAQAAAQRVRDCMKAVEEFEAEITKEQIEAVKEAAANSPVQEEISATADFLDSMVTPEVTEAPTA